MKRIYVNEKWCLGCHLCEYYCAFANSGEDNMAKALKLSLIHIFYRFVNYTRNKRSP